MQKARSMLTNTDARAAQPGARAYKLHDELGLFLHVAPSGAKRWRLKFRWPKGPGAREQLMTLGSCPDVPLAQARARRDAARDLLSRGTDPRNLSKKVDIANTFGQIALAWHAHNRPGWSDKHASDVHANLERDLFPELGQMVIAEITPPQLLALLRGIENRGRIETARRVRQRLAEIFAFGIAEGLAENNPATNLGAALRDPPPARPQPALVRIEDCRALLATCDHVADNRMVALASRLLALTAVRLDALRGACWNEFDLETRTWTVPAARMKLKLAKKSEGRFDFVVPLSAAAIAVLEEVRTCAISQVSPSVLVFPGRDPSKPIGENALRDLYARAGFAGRHVPHGWRASFSTLLNLDLGPEWRSDIDAALAHTGKGKVEAAYNRAELLDRRRVVFDRWGELLTG